MCGSTQLSRKTVAFVCHDGFRVSGIECFHCRNCGEKFYDKEASTRIDKALRAAGRLARKGSAVAA
jgi:hypothetical protein